jgi:hypothetical protein
MFLFALFDGVEPTNHAAERALRHGVLWRKMMERHFLPIEILRVKALLSVYEAELREAEEGRRPGRTAAGEEDGQAEMITPQ